ncbi:MAG: ParB/RepB/Spo0J family partition protein [Bacteroidetes bacterium]|nr:ParB/RepB/Spo0J family partition protein [Bacteroidota bacterium]
MAKKNVLGRGLGALIDEADAVKKEILGSVSEIELGKIAVNPYQPRSLFDEESLQELASSIRELGIIQPITVRMLDDGSYQLITGERRLRAGKIAGLKTIPAYVRIADDQNMLEMALVENIQREDLDAIEVALSFQRLLNECRLTQESLSDRVGKKRSTISNYLRLLKLPVLIQHGIRERKITMGHARAMVNIEDPDTQIMIYRQIQKFDFSVRKVEGIVKELNDSEFQKNTGKNKNLSSGEYDQLKEHLSKFFRSNVEFKRNTKGHGKIVIHFDSDEELERIIDILDKISS